jgi:hypothetical protein
MRSTSLARAATATAAAFLLTACGGGSDDSASSTSAASSSSAESSSSAAESSSEAPASGSEFCTRAQQSLSDFGSSVGDAQDPAQAEQQFREAAEEIRGIEPPQEIADDWNALADGLEEIAGTVAGATSNNDQEAAAEMSTQLQELQQSATAVATYLQQECGIDAGTTSESAAPSS